MIIYSQKSQIQVELAIKNKFQTYNKSIGVAQLMHKQIQIAPGVYLTDFRKDKNLIGLEQQKKQLTNDVGLLLDQVEALQNKILQLEYSIREIQLQENWSQDQDFVQAIEINWQCIVKFSSQLKEKILRLYELKYQPESQKMEELLKLNRVETREDVALEEVKKNILKRSNRAKQLLGEHPQKQLAKVNDEDSDDQTINKGQKQDDKGVYV